MKKTETEQLPVTDAELDAVLAQMAEDVPPMPADFHDKWMNAVRAEARQTVPAAEEPAPEKKTVSIVRWTRILSVAAVFVFLIGGTLLYRSSKKSLSVPYAAEKREAVETAASPADGGEPEAAAAGETLSMEEEPVMAVSWMQASAAYEDTAEEAEAEEDSTAHAMKATGSVQNAYSAPAAEGASYEAEEAAYEAEADYAAEADWAEEAAWEASPAMTAAPTPVPTPEATAAPTATSAPTATPTGTPVPAEETAEERGVLSAAGAFFTDMGEFLLAALPYLLVLAVPAAAVLIIRRKKAGSRGQKTE